MPRVARARNPTASSPPTSGGTASAVSPSSTAPAAAPSNAPTSGAQRIAAAATAGVGAPARTGSTVSQLSASSEAAGRGPALTGRCEVGRRRRLGQQPGRHLQQREHGQRAGAVAEPDAEVQHRASGPGAGRRWPWPARGSAGPAATRPWRPPSSSSATSAAARGDQPVQQHGRAPDRGLQAEPGQRGQVGAAGHPQQRQRVARVRLGPAQRVPDGGGLAHPAGVVDAAAAPDRGHRLGPGQRGDQHRRRGAGADAERSGHQQVGPAVDLLVGQRPPERERLLGLGRGERVLAVDPAAARGAPGTARRARLGERRLGQRRRPPPAPRPRPPGRARRPARCARAPRPPARSVIADGCAETPASAIPWSPAITTTRGRAGGRGGQLPWAAASQTPSSASRPRAPAGTASSACRATAARRASASGATTGGDPPILPRPSYRSEPT